MNLLNNKIFILSFIIIVFVSGSLLYIYNPEPTEYKNPRENTFACTMDARLCPDGSYVGREGPNCEFKACPNTTNTTTPVKKIPTNQETPVLQ